MLYVQTLLVSSVAARAGFFLVFLLYSFRAGAVKPFRFWTLSIVCSVLGLWLTYQDETYPHFTAEKGAIVYLIVGLSIVSVRAGANLFFGLPINRTYFLATWLAPSVIYWTAKTAAVDETYVLVLTMTALSYVLGTASFSFLKGGLARYLPSQLLVGSALGSYALALTGTIISLIVGRVFGYEDLGPSGSYIYLPVFVDQTFSVLIYVGLVAMTLEDAQRQMKIAATTDPLTGLANRRGLNQRTSAIIGAGRRLRRPMAVLMADVDYFKSINDRYGHAYGDLVLVQFAERIRASFRRQQDVVARWGGVEFVVVLHDTSLDDAEHLAKALCRTIENTPFEIEGVLITVTASIGVAPFTDDAPQLERTIDAADAGLYEAKRNGRNRVCLDPTIAAQESVPKKVE